MRSILLPITFVVLLAPLTGRAADLTAERVAEALGFDGGDKEKFVAGEIVTSEIEETTEKQLALALAFLTQASIDEIADEVLDGVGFEINPAVVHHGEIDPAAGAAALAGVALDEAEVEALLEVEPGDDFNLSSEEIASFRAIAGHQGADAGDPAVAGAVNAAYREMLAGRLQAYMAEGLDGIAPYDRGDGSSSAAEDLRAAAEAVRVLPEADPDLFRAFVDYPDSPLADVEHAFFWAEQRAGDRPVFVLVHTMIREANEQLIVFLRTFYAGHSFNASQVVAGGLPVDQGLAILYTNRTSTDQVAGFMSGTRHSVGRGMMQDELISYFTQVKEELAQ